jgi:hypothetical protein
VTDKAVSVSNLWRERSRIVLEVAVCSVAALAFAAMALGILALLLTGNHPGGRDFVAYWVAGHQIVHHANPYDSATVFALERSVGFPAESNPLLMRNPPSALPLVMPLGFLSLRAASLLWSLLLIAAFAGSVHMLRVLLGCRAGRLQWLGYSFGPALACIFSGQTGLFCLLGLVVFLRLHRTRPFAAGAALWFCALKPHLFLPFGVVLLAWIVLDRSYGVFAGAAASMCASSALIWSLDPAAWSQYRSMMQSSWLDREFIPCLGVALRFLIRPQAMWIEYLPAAAGCVWAVFYYARNRIAWDWLQHGALLMLVSIFVTPYAWLSDQSLLIPALLLGAYRATSRWQIGLLLAATAAIEVQLLSGVTVHSPQFLWTAPLWLTWYLYVTASAPASKLPRTVTPAAASAQPASL